MAALPPLSPEEWDKILEDYPEDGDRRIEEVKLYYTGHADKPFPGWTEAVKTFAYNQHRWNKGGQRRGERSLMDIINEVLPEG